MLIVSAEPLEGLNASCELPESCRQELIGVKRKASKQKGSLGQHCGDRRGQKQGTPTIDEGPGWSIASCYWKLGPRLISNSPRAGKSDLPSTPMAQRGPEIKQTEAAQVKQDRTQDAANMRRLCLFIAVSSTRRFSCPSSITPSSHGGVPAIPPNDATPSMSGMPLPSSPSALALLWDPRVGPPARASANFSRPGKRLQK